MLDRLLLGLGPLLAAVLLCSLALWLADWLLLRRPAGLGSGAKLPRQLALLGLTGISVVIVVLTLPVNDSTRNQLLGLLGLALTAVIALSSTTFIANVMAGVMLRSVKNFKPGDFVSVAEHFGRVTERGLFHVELQTENRDLTTLPNLFLVTHPVSVIRSSGTIVSTTLSLGYDVGHTEAERLLLAAATATELADPFVQVVELGNYAVTYRVAGFLEDVKRIITVRSNLRRQVLDALHGAGVEIVSPSFMNQRQLSAGVRAIPPTVSRSDRLETDPSAEALAFDKAEAASQLEHLKQARIELAAQIEETASALEKADDAGHVALERTHAQRSAQLAAVEQSIARLERGFSEEAHS